MKKIIDFVSNQLCNDNTGHGLQHALRVYNNAKKINSVEKGDEKIVLTASLIHDTIDKKLFKNTTEQINLVRQALIENNYTQSEIDEIVYIITNISWNNGKNNELNSLNAKIVRDADRLDALGAMGIIRTIEYGNSHHQPFYDENNIKMVNNHFTFNQITKSSLSHFYEKLLLLKDNLHTDTARKMAETRHKFLLSFLQQFYDEL
jgi:uncharacterized protein